MNTSRRMGVHKATWPLRAPFRITGYLFDEVQSVVVEISEGNATGRGEGVGVYYLGETADSMLAQIESIRDELEAGASCDEVQQLLPPGGARNAVDCALWDLRVQVEQRTIWQLTDLEPASVQTVLTLGISETASMAKAAEHAARYPVLKVKLDAEKAVERVAAIRASRPDARIVIDANQAFSMQELRHLMPELHALGVSMIEQPLPRGGDDALRSFDSPVPLCADESCLHRGDLDDVSGGYDMINIKLDKTGGLTEALQLARAARAKGKKIMVGNMLGTSLSMAPAFVIAQLSDLVDLDGPLSLRSDYAGGLAYDGPQVSAGRGTLWGMPR